MNKKHKFKIIFPFSYLSNAIALSWFWILPLFSSSDTIFSLCFPFAVATSLLIQTWGFKIKKIKESTFKITPKQLDIYIAHSYKTSFYVYVKVFLVVLPILFPHILTAFPLIAAVGLGGAYIAKTASAYHKKIKTPSRTHKLKLRPLTSSGNTGAGTIDYAYMSNGDLRDSR